MIGFAFVGKVCHGLFFKQLLFVIDTIFDAFYAIFPLIMALRDQGALSLALANAKIKVDSNITADYFNYNI